MPKKPKSRDRQIRFENERDYRRAVSAEVRRSALIRLIDRSGQVLNTAVKFGCPVGIAWALAWGWVNSAADLAGRETRIEMALTGLVNILVSKWVYWLIIALLGGTVLVQGKSSRRRIAELASQKKGLEEKLDPKRSSSGLTPRGRAPEE